MRARIRDSVFGSENERELYTALHSHWADRFDLYPSLPFASVIDFSSAPLSHKQRAFLYKTSVDYTLCTKQGRPLVSVDFDGLGHGFNRNGAYVEVAPSSRDPHRKLKFDLKLKLCREAGRYPLFIVSYDEKSRLGPDLTLTIVDGLIGQTLARKHLEAKMLEYYELQRDTIESLPPDERHEFIQDHVVISAEVDTELTWDPIAREAAQLAVRSPCPRMSFRFLVEPPLPKEGDPFSNPELFRRRAEAIKNAYRVGCEVKLFGREGSHSETVWVRNFNGMGISPLTIAQNIAELLAYRRCLAAVA